VELVSLPRNTGKVTATTKEGYFAPDGSAPK
jgi:hypothetical protein